MYAVDIYPLIGKLAGFQALNNKGTLKGVEAMLQDCRYQLIWTIIVDFYYQKMFFMIKARCPISLGPSLVFDEPNAPLLIVNSSEPVILKLTMCVRCVV